MHRREFLERSVLASGFAPLLARRSRAFQTSPAAAAVASAAGSRLTFETTDAAYQATYTRALETLARNVTKVFNYAEPVLIEGSNYSGVWMECAPLEGLAYADIDPVVARQNHLVFFASQREDGQIPCWVRTSRIGFAQIQMVVPIAATAWELAQATGDSELLEKAYAGWAKWDGWLRRHRNTRGTGLCEAFCTYDTGHDNSPRWTGMPSNCPDGEARNLPPVASLPRLSPDLSATVHGGRVALAAMARALGKKAEADRWLADAETIRTAIMARLYSSEDAAFYDVDAQDRIVRVRGDVIGRVVGEHVADQSLFETIYRRQIRNPSAFWSTYPLPSIAMDDPAFVRPIPRNSWGGASQALTALRAPRWMEHYGKAADLAYLMQQWTRAIVRDGKFLQQMDPVDGVFTQDLGDYSPAALCFMEFTWRLSGVRLAADLLHWNVRPPAPDVRARYRLRITPTSAAEVRYEKAGAELLLNDKVVYRTTTTARFVTDRVGKLVAAVGIGPNQTMGSIRHVSGRERTFRVSPNESVAVLPL
jgi:hypothetical protein